MAPTTVFAVLFLQFLQRFADGQVKVHYNPRDPNQAGLDVSAGRT